MNTIQWQLTYPQSSDMVLNRQWACVKPCALFGQSKCFRILGYSEKGRWYGLYIPLIILVPFVDGQSISRSQYTLTRRDGWCGLHMSSSGCYPGMVRVFQECLCVVQHIFYLKSFLCHLIVSRDISHLNPNFLMFCKLTCMTLAAPPLNSFL